MNVKQMADCVTILLTVLTHLQAIDACVRKGLEQEVVDVSVSACIF